MDKAKTGEIIVRLNPSQGGKARAESLTPAEREDIARKAAEARWNRLKATHEGELKIGEITIPCFVLEDGTRVISQRGMSTAFGRFVTGSGTSKAEKGKPKDGDAKLPSFLSAKNLKPFISEDLAASLTDPILFRPKQGHGAYGFKAELVPQICAVWSRAKDAGVLRKKQIPTAEVANILLLGLASTGIIALVDEATGYQYARARWALEEILEQFIAKELVAWAKRFPDDFYQEMFRLKNWQYRQHTTKRPIFVGKLTNDLVYERLAPGVLEELKRITPRDDKGRLKNRYHQLTEDVGHPRLREHLKAVITLMRAFDDWPSFYRALNRSLEKQTQTPLLDWAESQQETGSGQNGDNKPSLS